MIDERSAKMYCIDNISLIENYEDAINDSNETWVCHHRMETHRRNGKLRSVQLSKDDLIDWRIYCNRPASELIFLKHSEHATLHNRGRLLSKETRRRMSEAAKGANNNFFGKKHSEESRKKMSEARKAYLARTKQGE